MSGARILKRGLVTLICCIWALSIGTALADDTGAIPQRKDIDNKYKWAIEDIYDDVDSWEADFILLESGLDNFEQYANHLGDSPEMLLNCLKISDSLDIITGNLYVYAYLKLDEDNRRSEFQELVGRISALNSRLVQAQSFIRPEILAMGKEKVVSFIDQDNRLEIYRFYFEDMFRQNEHILSPEEEAIMALAEPMGGTPLRIFNMIDNADHKLGSIIDRDSNKVDLTYGRYTKILKGTDREQRRIANDTVQQSWMRYINTLSATLGSSLEKDLFYTKARKYNSTLERSLDGDNIPVSVFHNLIDAVNANLEPLHKWTALRKKVLGYDTLYTYDLSVSVVPEFEKEYPYEEARDIILKALKPMGDQYVKDLKNGFDSRWIDVYENEGKGSGAYSWGSYTSHPYVLMNYADVMRDMFTVAHEMGHSMNGYYTNRTEPYIYHNHSIFTAEVASTCNEALMMKYLLANAKSKDEKMVLLDYYIRQISGTFFTQVMFSEFELAIHEHVQNGGAVSVDYFRKTYREIFQKYNGPDLVIGENNDMGGMKIYHFYRTYYVYQYATCYCAAQMISQKIIEGDKDALDEYLKFLATGSSDYPVEILKKAGVDMNSPEAVERTIKLFGELVDEMEKLLEEN